MNPIKTKETIRMALIENVSRFYPVKKLCEGNDDAEKFSEEFLAKVEGYEYVSDPYVERIPFYRQKSESGAVDTTLSSMVVGGCIEEETANLFAAYFGKPAQPEQVRLYEHQVLAAQAVAAGKNLIVSTGTGSGKTESFLIPVLNAIIKERKEKGEAYEPGVRAMILYPMNALVNDQVRRIRDILRQAEAQGIDYANEITFGKYTGEVDTMWQERQNRRQKAEQESNAYEELREKLDELQQQENIINTEHPYLDDESTISKEYSRRLQWEGEHGAADILITNYSMLERLMLDPGRDAIFQSATWKFIVLDEAHTYDGGSGTEIAWLMRRLTGRITQGAERKNRSVKLQYIATSATLFEKGKKDQAQKFGSCLFPAAEGSFSVQEGYMQRQLDKNDIALQQEPFVMLNREDPRYSNPTAASLLENAHEHPELVRLWEHSQGEREKNIMALTKWYQNAVAWLDSLGFFRKFVDMHLESSVCSLGDFIAVCRQLAEYEPPNDAKISIDGATKDFLNIFISNIAPDDLNDVIKHVLQPVSQAELDQIRDNIENYFDDTEDKLNAQNIIPVAQLLCEKCEVYSEISQKEDEDREYTPLAWKVILPRDTVQYLKDVADRMRYANKSLSVMSDALKSDWLTLLNMNGIGGDICDVVSAFLLKYQELYQFEDILNKNGGHVKWQEVMTIFKSPEAFDDFSQLLALSRHPEVAGKPLMDLRFHQTINGISSMGVWFEVDENHRVIPHVLVDYDGQLYTDDRGKSHPVYTLGMCAKCAQPYLCGYVVDSDKIGGFEKSDDDLNAGKDYPFTRYCSMQSSARDIYEYYAFAWFIGNQNDNRAADAAEEQGSPHYWLEYDSGRIYKRTQDEKPQNSIPLYLIAWHSDNEGNSPTHIASCPACGGCDLTKQTGQYGIIAPFKTQETAGRNVALYSMCSHADRMFTMDSHPQAGRKVLAFSDSRQKAASLGVYFENFMKVRVIEETLTLSLLNNDSKTLAMIAREIRDELAKRGALSLLHFVYSTRDNQDNNVNRQLDELNGSALAVLSCMRKSGRNSLLNRNRIEVLPKEFEALKLSSKKHWEEWCEQFGNEDAAEKSFINILAYLYMRAEANSVGIDGLNNSIVFSQAHMTDSPGQKLNYLNGAEKWRRLPISWRDGDDTIRIDRNARNKIIKSYVSDEHVKNRDRAIAILKKLLTTEYQNPNDVTIRQPRLLVKIDNTRNYELNLDAFAYRLGKDAYSDWALSIETVFRAEEHTAQIELEKGRLYQSLFAAGKINVLSCSTTFEMGVDLGSLNSVFLCNMPPTAANYTQRAGRAGRRAGSASHVVTFMGSRPHDKYFRENPEILFFGAPKPPKLYMDNETYRAKHLRAEALHDFLQFSWGDDGGWKKSGVFFLSEKTKGGYWDRDRKRWGDCEIERIDGLQLAVRLATWIKMREKELQDYCETHVVGESIGYSVAYDLSYQLCATPGQEIEKWKAIDNLSRKLAGPRVNDENSQNCDLQTSYRLKRDMLGSEHQQMAIHMLSTPTVDYLAQNRVLPIYGFPCDVIELEPHPDDIFKPRLSRDKRIGIYEYALGKKVLADRMVYESNYPVFYQRFTWDNCNGQKQLKQGALDMYLWRCSDYRCGQFFEFNNEDRFTCSACGGNCERIRLCSPDAFRSKRSQLIAGSIYDSIGQTGRSLYVDTKKLEAIRYYHVRETKILLREPEIKEIMYLNTASGYDCPQHDEHLHILYKDKDGNRTTNKEDAEGFFEPEHFDGFIHKIRTDFMVFSTLKKPTKAENWEQGRLRHAWESASQALCRAAAIELKVNENDLEAKVVQLRHDNFAILLIDGTSNGSGILLPFMELYERAKSGKEVQAKEDNIHLLKQIFERARDNCKACSCYSDNDERIPLTHEDYLAIMEEDRGQYREYTACYGCLNSYRNQNLHDTLDAHDAAVILEGMLGNGNESGGMQQIAEHDSAADGCVVQPLPEASGSAQSGATTKQPIKLTPEVLQQLTQGILQPPVKLLVKLNNNETQARFTGRDRQSNLIVKINDTKRIFSENDMKTIMWEN